LIISNNNYQRLDSASQMTPSAWKKKTRTVNMKKTGKILDVCVVGEDCWTAQ